MDFFVEPEFNAVFSRIEPIVADVSGRESQFLSVDESESWRGFRNERRRNTWLAGRICLKSLWLRYHEENQPFVDDWTAMDIVSRNKDGKGVPPTLHVGCRYVDRSFSLSHTDLAVLAVLSKHEHRRIGCDLVPVGSFSQGRNPFIFHESEQEWIRRNADAADRIWAVKEAVYKAMSADRPFAPLQWHVEERENAVFTCRSVETDGTPPFVVPTRLYDGHVFAVAMADSVPR